MSPSDQPNLRLVPLTPEDASRLQPVYEAAADYFEDLGEVSVPSSMAERTLLEAANTPGRHIMGITLDGDLIGVLDFRLGYPAAEVAQLGLILLVPEQRGRGLGSLALDIWETWLEVQTPIRQVRAAVPAHLRRAQRFFLRREYHFTGEAYRVQVGEAQPRLLVMTKLLGIEPPATTP